MHQPVFAPCVSILHKAVIHCAVLGAAKGLILLHHRSCWWCVGVSIVYVPPNRFKAINFSCHYIFSLPLSAEFRIASETGAGNAGLRTPQPSNSKTQGLQFLVANDNQELAAAFVRGCKFCKCYGAGFRLFENLISPRRFRTERATNYKQKQGGIFSPTNNGTYCLRPIPHPFRPL